MHANDAAEDRKMHAKDTEEDPTVLCCWPGDGWVRGAVVRRISLSLAVWDLECTDYSTSHNTGGGGADGGGGGGEACILHGFSGPLSAQPCNSPCMPGPRQLSRLHTARRALGACAQPVVSSARAAGPVVRL